MGILSDLFQPKQRKTLEELKKEAEECEERANYIERIEKAKKKEHDAKMINRPSIPGRRIL